MGRAGLLAWLVCRLHCADLCVLPAHQLSSKHDACVAHVRRWSPGIFYAGLRALEPGLGVAAAGRFAGGHSHKAGRLDRAELVPFASRTRAAVLRRQVFLCARASTAAELLQCVAMGGEGELSAAAEAAGLPGAGLLEALLGDLLLAAPWHMLP